MNDYVASMRVLIARLLLVLSVLPMPLGMAPAAAVPHAASMAGMPVGHCDQQPDHSRKSGIAECTMACAAALPAVEAPRERPVLIACEQLVLSLAAPLHGLHPGPATPPPKRS